MCLIIHRPASRGIHVPNAVLDHNRTQNPDGTGIAWRDAGDGAVCHERYAPADYRAFHRRVKSLDKSGAEYVAHFRYATSGPVCQEMSHPFMYRDSRVGDVAVFHNGVIDIDNDPTESDTATFVRQVLARLPSRWWHRPHLRFLVESAVAYSRLLIMSRDETIRLNGWRTIDGINYSTAPLPAAPGPATKSTPAGWYQSPGEWSLRQIAPVSATVTKNNGWYHEGHHIQPLTRVDEDVPGDYSGRAECVACKSVGDYYSIDGTTYTDIGHSVSVADLIAHPEWAVEESNHGSR